MRWEKVEQPVGLGEADSGPGKRSSHTCNTIKEGRFIYVFGGYDRANRRYVNQVDVFDTKYSIWSRPLINGIHPSPREGHTCTTVKDNLFVFGGSDMNRDSSLNDLHVLDTSTTTHTWIQPVVRGEPPQARENHTATLVNNHIFIFGGMASALPEEEYFNDLYMLNTETFEWTRPLVFRNLPAPRASHTCSLWKHKLIVIGGEDSNALHILSDVHVFDTNTMTWDELQTSGEVLTPRAEHVAVSLGGKLFVFGGLTDDLLICNNDLYMIDLVSRVWSKVDSWGESPSDRCSAAGVCLNPYKNGVLVFMGGSNAVEDLDDMYYLYTGSLNDEDIDQQDSQNCQKQEHKSVLVKRKFEAMMGTETIPTQMSDSSFNTGEDSSLQNKEKGTVDAEDTNTNTEQLMHKIQTLQM